MKLNLDQLQVDENRSNPMVVAMVYPDCPLLEKGVCAYLVVGFCSVVEQCNWLDAENEECKYSGID